VSEHTGQPHEQFSRPSAVRGGPDEVLQPDVVTAVIEHDVRAGAEAHYGVWVKEITAPAQRFPGYLGVNIIRPSADSRLYAIVLRFDTVKHLHAWLGAETRCRLIAQDSSLSEPDDQLLCQEVSRPSRLRKKSYSCFDRLSTNGK